MESLHSYGALRRLARIALAAMAALALAAPARAATDARETRLANGLRVIVKEDHRAPTIVSMVWYKAGSMDEFNGTTGVAHVLEHMMFKGTKTLKPGEFSRIVAAAGGRENAFTNRDYTAYFQQLHKSKLPLSFRLEADRMANLKLAPEEFAKEIQVVMEERRLRTEDQPQALVYEQLMATAFTSHPYRVPVIGWMDDLQHMTWHDARNWYDRWYVPNNAIVVVVGDVKAKEVFDLAQKYFGGIKARPLPDRKPQDEAPQRGIRRVTVKAPAELPYLIMGYHVPRLMDVERDWEPYALEVLAGVLDGNDAARLNANLVRGEHIANAVSAGYDSTARGPELFVVSGAPATGKTVDDLERGLRRELAKIIAEGVGDEELKRVKAQVVAAQVFQRDSMFFQAQQIGSLEIAGYPYQTIDLMISKIQQVTAAQVQEVAKKYLVDDELTVAVLDPQPLAGKKRPAPAAGDQHVR
jgi:zinc protease